MVPCGKRGVNATDGPLADVSQISPRRSASSLPIILGHYVVVYETQSRILEAFGIHTG